MYEKVANPTDAYCQYPRPMKRDPIYCQPIDAVLNEHAIGLIKDSRPRLEKYNGKTQAPKSPEQLRNMSIGEEPHFT